VKRALATLGLWLAVAHSAAGHDVEQAEARLAEIASHRQLAAAGPTEGERTEAVFRLGETVEGLVEALNRDVTAHGTRDLLAELVVRRLQAHGLGVTWAPGANRYVYDLAAFTEYLRLAPRGRWAPEAEFRLLARRFYATLGADPAALVGTDVAGLLDAVAGAERFLREHASHERAPSVQFFLGIDHYRLARHADDAARRRDHERLARQALQRTVERSSEPFEVRAAQTLLETLAAGRR
jgi:hypothetical protein